MAKTLKTRIYIKTDTTANWDSSSIVLGPGEVGIEKKDDGSIWMKVGDGVNEWSSLEYVSAKGDGSGGGGGGETTLEHILDGVASGSIRTSTATAEGPDYSLGNSAVAEGASTKAGGNFSHAEGFQTNASGAYSHAGGRGAESKGSRSFASGYNVKASGTDQTVIGKYNVEDTSSTYAFIIGDGTEEQSRSNLLTVGWDGSLELKGQKVATESFVETNGGKIDKISVNKVDLPIEEKKVDITVPKDLKDLTNEAGYAKSTEISEATSSITSAYTKAIGDKETEITEAYTQAISDKEGEITEAYTTAISQNKTTITEEYTSAIETAGQKANKYTDQQIAAIPAAAVYTIKKEEEPEEGSFATYSLMKGEEVSGQKINIPKDFLVKSGEVKTSNGESDPSHFPIGVKYLDFVVNAKDGESEESHIYINLNDLVDVYKQGNGIEVSLANIISVKVVNENGLSVDEESGIKLALASADAAGAMSQEHYTKLENLNVEELAKKDLSNVEKETILSKVELEPDTLAKTDLSNVENDTLKAKIEESGFKAGGTTVQILRWEESDS